MADAATTMFFRAQQEDPANMLCADSATAEPQWASISHGIYISIEASGVHRSLGVRTSYVQSMSMDAWRPVHLRMMELGGNKRFADFLRQHQIPEDMPIRQKYNTRAAKWYREHLRAMAEGGTPPAPLPEGTGHLPTEDTCSPEQLMLDRVFAKAPEVDAIVQGGALLKFVRKERSTKCLGSPRQAIADALPRLLGLSEGDRSAERLRTMSTGRMQGFGPVDGLAREGGETPAAATAA